MNLVRTTRIPIWLCDGGELMVDKKGTSVPTEGEKLSLVVLKVNQINYYLVDYKLTISIDRSSSMVFTDHDLASDYATKLENHFTEKSNYRVLGFTEFILNLDSINNLS